MSTAFVRQIQILHFQATFQRISYDIVLKLPSTEHIAA